MLCLYLENEVTPSFSGVHVPAFGHGLQRLFKDHLAGFRPNLQAVGVGLCGGDLLVAVHVGVDWLDIIREVLLQLEQHGTVLRLPIVVQRRHNFVNVLQLDVETQLVDVLVRGVELLLLKTILRSCI